MPGREDVALFILAFCFHSSQQSFALHSHAVSRFCCFVCFFFSCPKGALPPPRNLSYTWLNLLTVNVYWQRPSGLPEHCRIQYRWGPHNSSTEWTNFTETLLTDEAESSGWLFTVRTEGDCRAGQSAPASVLVDTPKPRAELVTDFKCLLQAEKPNCSWIPVDPSFNLTLSYGICAETRPAFKRCEPSRRHGIRNGCDLSSEFVNEDICVLVTSEESMSTFKPLLVVDPPNLRVTAEGDKFNLSWTPPEVGRGCSWIYELCYRQCDQQQTCQSFVPNGETVQMAYDERCRYEFRYRVTSGEYCKRVQSDTAVQVYGANAPARVSPTTVAVAVAVVVLSAGVLVGCYCLQRHSNLFWPVIPDPSAVLKTVSNGRSVMKAPAKVYTPVPETVQPCQAEPTGFVSRAGVLAPEPPPQGEPPC
ncbi:interleukin-13 receptor subunit alpha-1 [Syngnathoides biaculeatus]|uniref:interleukin-13 receptor subunit alpha-1 n=1 Tax=Syngnathoides biaculeatus TaxID=300417 RepID=UPI002ADE0BA1|nr:interleukin-13 receptor subunit alpha-1 [Syngnathoides biaculeatus]